MKLTDIYNTFWHLYSSLHVSDRMIHHLLYQGIGHTEKDLKTNISQFDISFYFSADVKQTSSGL